MFSFLRRNKEERVDVKISDRTGMIEWLGLSSTDQVEPVTINSALGVPAIWSAVNFLASSVASLPLHLYRTTPDGSERVTSGVNAGLVTVLSDAFNDTTTSFMGRKILMEQALTGGRGCAFIDRNAMGRVVALHPLDREHLTIVRKSGKTTYSYKDGGRTVTYAASEVIDLPFMLKSDMVDHYSPIFANASFVALAQAVTKHGATFFRNGGVPPFAVTGNFQSAGAMQRAAEDLRLAVKKAADERRNALVLPAGLEIKAIGTDAEKAQLVETQRFIVEQVARIYSLPPVFLQDLTHGTFANTEQQDLHFVKHTLSRWVRQIEDELNLKLFGRGNRKLYVKFSVDGLLRGDFKARMEGYAQAIQNGVMTPNEARDLEDRPPADGGEGIFMQGAMMPVSALGKEGTQE